MSIAVDIVTRPEWKAAAIRVPRDGARVREAWKELESLLGDHPAVTERDFGYVFIPEWQWATEVTTLWVGVPVNSFEGLPSGIETLTIPARQFAATRVLGDAAMMHEAYEGLAAWFRSGPYERDVDEGTLGYERNSLTPVNPFHIPANAIDTFNYEVYAPIKGLKASSIEAYPGILGAEVRKGRARRIVGMELEVFDRKKRGLKPEEIIPRFWQGVMPRLDEIRDRKPPYGTIGLYSYAPPFGPGQDFRYFAGTEVEPDSDASLPEGMSERTIPADDTLVVTYRGKADGFGRAWDYFHGLWRQRQSAYDAIDDYEFEQYDERFLGPDREASVFELHFPIRPRVHEAFRLTEKLVVDEKGGHVLQDLRGERLRMISFQGADFHGIDMRGAKLRHVNFVGAEWEHMYFADVRIDEIQMGGTVFSNIRRPDAPESRLDGEPGTDGWVNVEPVVFRDSDLSEARFERCDLRNASLEGCRLEGMRIDGILVSELLAAYRNRT
jgi:predicted transcriptional regulator YdeE